MTKNRRLIDGTVDISRLDRCTSTGRRINTKNWHTVYSRPFLHASTFSHRHGIVVTSTTPKLHSRKFIDMLMSCGAWQLPLPRSTIPLLHFHWSEEALPAQRPSCPDILLYYRSSCIFLHWLLCTIHFLGCMLCFCLRRFLVCQTTYCHKCNQNGCNRSHPGMWFF